MAEAPAPDCLTTLLGLTDTAPACYTLPVDEAELAAVTDTATGLYLTDAEGLRLGPATGQQCGTDIYDRLAKARRLGAFQLRADLEAGRLKSFGPSVFQQRGSLGGTSNGQLAPVGTPARLRFATAHRYAGAYRLTRLALYADQPVTDAPLLLDGEQVSLVSSVSGPVKGLLSGLPAGGLLVPLDGESHTLEVVLPDGVRVYRNKVYCFGCNAGSPWALSVKNSILGWDSNTEANGLSLQAAEECTADADMLCYIIGSDEEGSPARYPDLTRHIGLALLYKAAQLFTDSLLADANKSRYTMLEPKALAALSDKYAGEYTQRLAWLNSPGGLGQVQHPCYAGSPSRGPSIIRTT